MVEKLDSTDLVTSRYACEACGSIYVHKGDAIHCEESCSIEDLEAESLFEDSPPSKRWTEHSLDDLL
ncbi:MAG: hypothetical protein MAG715_01232 [Methanonatronarchaeales archaeon]|nr:hypothetical protein [Methanonatronarchaeales archaeon]